MIIPSCGHGWRAATFMELWRILLIKIRIPNQFFSHDGLVKGSVDWQI